MESVLCALVPPQSGYAGRLVLVGVLEREDNREVVVHVEETGENETTPKVDSLSWLSLASRSDLPDAVTLDGDCRVLGDPSALYVKYVAIREF